MSDYLSRDQILYVLEEPVKQTFTNIAANITVPVSIIQSISSQMAFDVSKIVPFTPKSVQVIEEEDASYFYSVSRSLKNQSNVLWFLISERDTLESLLHAMYERFTLNPYEQEHGLIEDGYWQHAISEVLEKLKGQIAVFMLPKVGDKRLLNFVQQLAKKNRHARVILCTCTSISGVDQVRADKHKNDLSGTPRFLKLGALMRVGLPERLYKNIYDFKAYQQYVCKMEESNRLFLPQSLGALIESQMTREELISAHQEVSNILFQTVPNATNWVQQTKDGKYDFMHDSLEKPIKETLALRNNIFPEYTNMDVLLMSVQHGLIAIDRMQYPRLDELMDVIMKYFIADREISWTRKLTNKQIINLLEGLEHKLASHGAQLPTQLFMRKIRLWKENGEYHIALEKLREFIQKKEFTVERNAKDLPLAVALQVTAEIHNNMGKHDDAIKYLDDSLKHFPTDNYKGLNAVYMLMGDTYMEQNIIRLAIVRYIEACDTVERLDIPYMAAKHYARLSNALVDSKNVDNCKKALESLRKAFSYFAKVKETDRSREWWLVFCRAIFTLGKAKHLLHDKDWEEYISLAGHITRCSAIGFSRTQSLDAYFKDLENKTYEYFSSLAEIGITLMHSRIPLEQYANVKQDRHTTTSALLQVDQLIKSSFKVGFSENNDSTQDSADNSLPKLQETVPSVAMVESTDLSLFRNVTLPNNVRVANRKTFVDNRWSTQLTLVVIDSKEVGKGGNRQVVEVFDISQPEIVTYTVAKKYIKFVGEEQQSLSVKDVEKQRIAQSYAHKFTQDVKVKEPQSQVVISFIPTYEIEYEEETSDGWQTISRTVEPFIHGEFIKYNGSGGAVYEDNHDEYAQAFSHATYLYSEEQEHVVTDIQGWKHKTTYYLTDPYMCVKHIDSEEKRTKQIGEFKTNHKCNRVCKMLGFAQLN